MLDQATNTTASMTTIKATTKSPSLRRPREDYASISYICLLPNAIRLMQQAGNISTMNDDYLLLTWWRILLRYLWTTFWFFVPLLILVFNILGLYFVDVLRWILCLIRRNITLWWRRDRSLSCYVYKKYDTRVWKK